MKKNAKAAGASNQEVASAMGKIIHGEGKIDLEDASREKIVSAAIEIVDVLKRHFEIHSDEHLSAIEMAHILYRPRSYRERLERESARRVMAERNNALACRKS